MCLSWHDNQISWCYKSCKAKNDINRYEYFCFLQTWDPSISKKFLMLTKYEASGFWSQRTETVSGCDNTTSVQSGQVGFGAA